MKKNKKKVRVWGKIKLFETSVVGVPAYPNAHMSTSCSLIKALTNHSLAGDEQLNGKNSQEMETEETKEVETEETKEEEVVEESTEEEPAKESTEEAPAETEKSISTSIAKAIKEGLAKGFKDLQKERGLVSKDNSQKKAEDTVKSMSAGQLLVDGGLFKKE